MGSFYRESYHLGILVCFRVCGLVEFISHMSDETGSEPAQWTLDIAQPKQISKFTQGTLARPSKTAALGDTQPSVTFARARSTVVTWAGGEPLSITGQEDTNRQCLAKSNARGARQ